jgi:hypothetical protein
MGRFETHVADTSKSNLELPPVPKHTLVGVFTDCRSKFSDECYENDARYKATLILMSTTEETNYHDGPNKPVMMIMVRAVSPFSVPPNLVRKPGELQRS